jgi:hypothetical protein
MRGGVGTNMGKDWFQRHGPPDVQNPAIDGASWVGFEGE